MSASSDDRRTPASLRYIGRASPLGNTWVLESKYDQALLAICKSTPGLRWNGGAKKWVGPRDAMVALSSRAAVVGLRVDVLPVQIVSCPLEAEPEIREYQLEAARFLLLNGEEGCILGDAMGLGKTASALTAARKVARLLVVSPNYVKDVWRRELPRWGARSMVAFPAGTKATAKGLDTVNTVVIHYDILHAWSDVLAEWLAAPQSAVVFDEGHMLQSETSKRSIGARKVAKPATYRWALTGTPLSNRPHDLWNVVDVVSPGRLGSFFAFGLRHCDAHQEQVTPEKVVWKFDGKSNLDELQARSKHFMLRRTVDDVGLQLPPKTRQVLYLDCGKTGASSYAGIGDTISLRRSLDLAADMKQGSVWDVVRGHLEAGAKVGVFTWRRSVAEFFADRARQAGFFAEVCHGGISGARRGAAIERMRGSPEGEGALFAATIDSASVGIDLTFANIGVFAEIDYKPHALLQAEARFHRFGQSKPVLIQYCLGKGTIDEVIADVVIGKLDTFAEALGSVGERLSADLRGDEGDIMGELMAAIEGRK